MHTTGKGSFSHTLGDVQVFLCNLYISYNHNGTFSSLSSFHLIFSPCLLFNCPSSILSSSFRYSSPSLFVAHILSTQSSKGPGILSIKPIPTVLTFCLSSSVCGSTTTP